MTFFDSEDEKYIKSCLDNGTNLNQAIAQLEALKDENLFKIQLLGALNQDEIKKKILELLQK